MTTAAASAPSAIVAPGVPQLSRVRVHLMRFGYLFMAVGLVLVKWPLFFRDGGLAAVPVYEGVVAALLTAMSLLAMVGLIHPVRMLTVLVFESLWKLIWLAAVGVPRLLGGEMDALLSGVLFNVSFVVVVLAVTPWDHVWKRLVR